MADLGLNLDLATLAVRDDDKKNKSGRKKKQRQPRVVINPGGPEPDVLGSGGGSGGASGGSGGRSSVRRHSKGGGSSGSGDRAVVVDGSDSSSSGRARRPSAKRMPSAGRALRISANRDDPARAWLEKKPGGRRGARNADGDPIVDGEKSLEYFMSWTTQRARQLQQAANGVFAEDDANGQPYLLHEELPDSDEDSSDDEFVDGLRVRFRDGSRKKMGELSRYRTITGNVLPTELSVSSSLDGEDIVKLTSRENFGIVFQPAGFWQVGKKNRKGKRAGVGPLNVFVTQHEYTGTLEAVEDEDETVYDDDEKTQASAIIYGNGTKKRHPYNYKRWPPRPLTDRPEPPREKPPRSRNGSHAFLPLPKPQPTSMAAGGGSTPKATKKDSRWRTPPLPPSRDPGGPRAAPPRPPPHSPPPPLRKQLSSSTMVTSTSGLMRKLGIFRGNGPSQASPANAVSSDRIEERFLVARKVPWIVPPPPQPRPPPADDSKEQSVQRKFELLRMFCEDLRSTAVKLQEKQDGAEVRIGQLQTQIQGMDDEIAGLVQPKGSHSTSADVVESQLKSVTSGNIFRVEKY